MNHLPNLNSLRFIAASLVMIHHVELYKSFFGLKNVYHIPFFEIIGKLGVVLFFNLSGFLITLLLLNELKNKGKIEVKKFYLRRVLRIWPLYFLILALAFFLFPSYEWMNIPKESFKPVAGNFLSKLLLFVAILPNLSSVLFGYVPYASQLWSVGTEEQFYLFWPWVIRGFKKYLLPVFIAIMLLYFLAGIFLSRYEFSLSWVLKGFWYYFNINCMAMGGIFAVIYFKKYRVLSILFNPITFFATLSLLVFLLFTGKTFGFFHYDVYGLLFCIIILNLALNPRFAKALEFPVLNHLGQISYGLYMYHVIFVTLGVRAAIYFDAVFWVYPVTFVGSISVAYLSYHWFERYFIKMKLKYN